ncbi:hypothetical protein Tco_1349267, partial [Tanacetum coccineum]
RKAHLLEDKQIPSVRVFDEVLFYTLFRAFGKLLEEIHVTWAHLEKKRTRLQLYTKVDKENAHSGWRCVKIVKRRRQRNKDGVRS